MKNLDQYDMIKINVSLIRNKINNNNKNIRA